MEPIVPGFIWAQSSLCSLVLKGKATYEKLHLDGIQKPADNSARCLVLGLLALQLLRLVTRSQRGVVSLAGDGVGFAAIEARCPLY